VRVGGGGSKAGGYGELGWGFKAVPPNTIRGAIVRF
jgi:hypothetical protein